MPEPRHVFEKETQVLKSAQKTLENQDITQDLLWKEYAYLTKNYEKLLGDSRVITNISDRLQNRLNAANENLQHQSEEIRAINTQLEKKAIELQSSIDELTRAKISRKATTITLIAAVILFIISEGLLEPWVEKYMPSNQIGSWVGFLMKGLIALLLKPIDYLVESYLKKEARRKSQDNPIPQTV